MKLKRTAEYKMLEAENERLKSKLEQSEIDNLGNIYIK